MAATTAFKGIYGTIYVDGVDVDGAKVVANFRGLGTAGKKTFMDNLYAMEADGGYCVDHDCMWDAGDPDAGCDFC